MRNANVASPVRRMMQGGNALKIGLFGANCSSGRAVTKVPERWSGTWTDNLRLVQMADEAGIDFMLPIGRWKGYGGDIDMHGESLETVTWATGLLAQTERITVFGTVHAPLFHPIIAAKQCVTADHVGEGRFGLNIVAGWNEGEFEMFGVEQREHDARYGYAQDWIDAIKKAWGPEEDFDFDGAQLKLYAGHGFVRHRDPLAGLAFAALTQAAPAQQREHQDGRGGGALAHDSQERGRPAG